MDYWENKSSRKVPSAKEKATLVKPEVEWVASPVVLIPVEQTRGNFEIFQIARVRNFGRHNAIDNPMQIDCKYCLSKRIDIEMCVYCSFRDLLKSFN